MAQIGPDSVIEIGGSRVPAIFCIPFDERGQQLDHVVWIDPEAGTFAQHLTDEKGRLGFDQAGLPIEIVRFGKVTLRLRELEP